VRLSRRGLWAEYSDRATGLEPVMAGTGCRRRLNTDPLSPVEN
jgi:hypothetical protein